MSLALAATLALGGCGSDDATTTTNPGTTAQQRPDGGARTTPSQEGDAKRGGGEKQEGSTEQRSGAAPFKEPTGPAPTTMASLPNEGSKEPAPGVPLAKGGDNSVQSFGLEAQSAERVEAARVLQAFVNARASHDWPLACSYLSSAIKAQVESLSRPSKNGDKKLDCAQAMQAFTAGVPEEALRTAADVRVLSMRVDGEQAIVIYRDGEGTPSTIPMNLEADRWRVSAIAGSALFLGA